ncbi:MAG: Dabb family protein [Phycisphaerales bacterium]|nr:Dabb family protein [Phycisphaerales bacterium]
MASHLTFVVAANVVFSTLGVVPGCANTHRNRSSAALLHVVTFDLADPGDASALIADSRMLALEIPTIGDLRVGTRLDSKRPGFDQSFDVALSMEFDSVKAYEAYLVHPAHVRLVERWTPFIESLRVIDAEVGGGGP